MKQTVSKQTLDTIARANTAIQMMDDLVAEIVSDDHPVKDLIADILQNRDNTPFLVTVYEAVEEVKPPVYANGRLRS